MTDNQPINWPSWTARLQQRQARDARRRRIRAALHLALALTITGIQLTCTLGGAYADNRGQAVFFAALTVISGIWTVDEYRTLRQALRPGVVSFRRRR